MVKKKSTLTKKFGAEGAQADDPPAPLPPEGLNNDSKIYSENQIIYIVFPLLSNDKYLSIFINAFLISKVLI